ncbi:hypothetical protein V8E36_006211 [Tilletia maclaganii]
MPNRTSDGSHEQQRRQHAEAEEIHPKVENALDDPANVFSRQRTILIIVLVTLSTWVAPMTCNVLMPALPEAAKDLNVTAEQINLSVFTYMIAQGVSPLFLGGTDAIGRRGIYTVCYTVYTGANIGLANLADGDFAGLLVLRFLQAVGAASMIAIGVGVVSDICTPKNRGSLMGIVLCGSLTGPALGPLIGGITSQAFGWRGIFWFCLILGLGILICLLALLPETVREARENPRIPLLLRKAWIDVLLERRMQASAATVAQPSIPTQHPTTPFSARNLPRLLLSAITTPLQALLVLRQPEITLILAAYALPFAAFYGLMTPLSDQFQLRYGFNTLQSGLVFLAPGLGISIAAVASGWALDRSFRIVRAEFEREWACDNAVGYKGEGVQGVVSGKASADTDGRLEDAEKAPPSVDSGAHGSAPTGLAPCCPPTILPAALPPTSSFTMAHTVAYFPFERARLRYYWHCIVMLTVGFIGFGWTLEFDIHPAVPIIFSFITGLATGGFFSILGCLLVDLSGGKGAKITSVNNVTRCLSSAFVAAVVQYLIRGVGIGWSQTIFGLVSLLSAVFPILACVYGPGWRRRRYERALAQAAAIQ